MTTMKHWLMILGLGLLTLQNVRAELVVIVNKASTVTALSQDEVARIFLKKLKATPDGTELVPVGQISSPEVEERFYLAVCNKDHSQLSAYWARLMFTGKDRPPIDGKDGKGVLEIVANNPRAIGYVDESLVNSAVRIVYRLH